jgi:hypothetical protein
MSRSKHIRFQQAAVITAIAVGLLAYWLVIGARHRAAGSAIECVRGWQADVVLTEGRLVREAAICEQVGRHEEHAWSTLAVLVLLGYVAGGFGFIVGYSTGLRTTLDGTGAR